MLTGGDLGGRKSLRGSGHMRGRQKSASDVVLPWAFCKATL